MPASAIGSRTRTLRRAPSAYDLERPRRGDAALDRRAELAEHELDRGERRRDVELVVPADVADPEDRALQLALAAGDRDAVPLPQRERQLAGRRSRPGIRTAVTTAERSSSGEKSSSPIALIPRGRRGRGGRAARRRRRGPRSSSRPSATSSATTSETAGVNALSSFCLRLARPLPVEVEARQRRALRPAPRRRPRRRRSRARAASSAPSASRRRRRRGPTRPSRAARRRGSRQRRRRPARPPPWRPLRAPERRRRRRSTSRSGRGRRATPARSRRACARGRRRSASRPTRSASSSTSQPNARAIAAQRSPNVAGRDGEHALARRAEVDDRRLERARARAVKRSTSFSVRWTSCSRPSTRAYTSRKSGRAVVETGSASAASTCGGTGVGPGVNRYRFCAIDRRA